MKKIIRILKLILNTKFNFYLPKSKKNLIFDSHNGREIKHFFEDNDLCLLDARYESINVFILLKTLFCFKTRLTFFQNYLVNFIDYVDPKNIITFVDNSYFFYQLKNYFKNKKIIIFQNGLGLIPFYKNYYKEKFSIDYFFTFGKSYKNLLFSKYGAKVYDVGSVRSNEKKILNTQKNYCSFISNFSRAPIMSNERGKIEKKFLRYVYDLANKKNLIFNIILRTDKIEEKNYFKKIFGSKKIRFKKNNNPYYNIDVSKILVGFHSTLGLEAISRGKKIVLFNIYNKYKYKNRKMDIFWPIKIKKRGFFWTDKYDEPEIKKIFFNVLQSDKKKWYKKISFLKKIIKTHDYKNKKIKFIIKNML